MVPVIFQRIIKRLIDVVVAATLLLVVGPFILVLALALRCESPGNPFFRQRRVGRNGGTFWLVKLRTLYQDQFGIDLQSELPLDSPRITSIGRWLRRTKLDELPQLIHVLSGKMSLAGPRPDIPEQVHHYSAEQRQRLRVRPGLTGAAQVCGNTALSWKRRIQIDNWYIDHAPWWIDVAIVLLTVRAIVNGEDAPVNRLKIPDSIFEEAALVKEESIEQPLAAVFQSLEPYQ
jgi:lipopolysaccharide/colanic/teichoic acid biosynthesis glycosyltransferase